MIKIFLYFFTLPFCMWLLDSIDMSKIFKKRKEREAQLFFITISIIMSYLLTNFIFDFINDGIIS